MDTTALEREFANGVVQWAEKLSATEPPRVLSFREALGAVLREERTKAGLTLREVSTGSMIALGYLSEIERGRKEASSIILEDVCDALCMSVADALRKTADVMDESVARRASVVREAATADVG